jgi:hypothetical protein
MNPESYELEVREPTHACYVVVFHCARLPYIISFGAVARAESGPSSAIPTISFLSCPEYPLTVMRRRLAEVWTRQRIGRQKVQDASEDCGGTGRPVGR